MSKAVFDYLDRSSLERLQHTDVDIIVEGGTHIRCHKLMLIKVWPMIAQLSTDHVMCGCECLTVSIPWMTLEMVRCVLALIYNGSSKNLTQQLLMKVREAMNYLSFSICDEVSSSKMEFNTKTFTSSDGFCNEVSSTSSDGFCNEVISSKMEFNTQTFTGSDGLLILPTYESDESQDSGTISKFQNVAVPVYFSPSVSLIEKGRNICNSACSSSCGDVFDTWSESDKSYFIKHFSKKESLLKTKNNLLVHLKSQANIGGLPTDRFCVNGLTFCNDSFAHITNISLYLVKTVLNEFWKGRPEYEHRNRGIIKQKLPTTNFIAWMLDFAKKYGQYAPDECKIILSYWLRKSVLYKMYVDESPGPHLAESTFYEHFDRHFGPFRRDKSLECIRIARDSSHSVCNICVALNNHRMQCKSEYEMEVAKGLINQVRFIFLKTTETFQNNVRIDGRWTLLYLRHPSLPNVYPNPIYFSAQAYFWGSRS